MKLLSNIGFKKISEILFINANTIQDTGFRNGKIGVSTCLFEIGKYLKNNIYTDLAFELLQEGISKDLTQSNMYVEMIENSCALQYLIDNKFIAASYLDLFEKEYVCILKNLEIELANQAKFSIAQNPTIKYILFYDRLHTILDNQYPSLKENLISHIIKYFLSYMKEDFNCNVISNVFYLNATILLKYIYTLEHIENFRIKELLELIIELDKLFTKNNKISADVLFYILLYNCCCKYYIESHYTNDVRKYMIYTSYNIIPDCLTYREKTDFYLYTNTNKIDEELRNFFYAKTIECIHTIISPDLQTLEERLFYTVKKRVKTGLGIDSGLARLILLHIYMEKQSENNQIIKLL